MDRFANRQHIVGALRYRRESLMCWVPQFCGATCLRFRMFPQTSDPEHEQIAAGLSLGTHSASSNLL